MGSDESHASRTPLAGRNRIRCDECESVIGGKEELKRTVKWGFWDVDTQNYDSGPRTEHYCQECWQRYFARDAAAYYEVTDPDRLWDILAAADGKLVADLKHMFVGGRGWIRVVDGELQGLHVTRDVDTRPDTPIVTHEVEQTDIDDEWFDDVFDSLHERDADDDSVPRIAMLKPVGETPFSDFELLPADQTTLDEQPVDGETNPPQSK